MESFALPASLPRLNYSFHLYQEYDLLTSNQEFSGHTKEVILGMTSLSPREDEVICMVRPPVLPPKRRWPGLKQPFIFF